MPVFSVEDTQQKVIAVIAEKLNIDKNTVNLTATVQELGADSLDLVEIVMKLEEAFGIEISDDDVAHLNTVQQYVDYVQQRRSK
jgi:acyl carrier protein